jgi:hypothetical protein
MMPTRFIKPSITRSGSDFVYSLLSCGFFADGREWAIYYDSSWRAQGIKHPYVYTIAIGSINMLFGMYEKDIACEKIEQIAQEIKDGETVIISRDDVWL